jgi:tight adherence protein C
MVIVCCVLLFCAVLVSVSAFGYRQYARPARMLQQLETSSSFSDRGSEQNKNQKRRFGAAALSVLGGILPSSPSDAKMTRRELGAAGFRSDSAPSVFLGLKVILTAGFLIAGIMLRSVPSSPSLRLVLPFALAGLGFKLPDIVLSRMIKRRQLAIRLALPDALDMLVVCCEAGCALDQAILNVSREFKMVHPALSEEFSMVNMELLAGASRVAALRNLADRTGEEELKKLVAILIQTDRFGTSVADALRTQADFMRVKRRQIAEEKAGKVGVKLVFPIFFFCMPSLCVLVMGPGLLQIMKELPALSGR